MKNEESRHVRLTFNERNLAFNKHFSLMSSELPSYGLPPGYLHHSHASQEAGLDYSFRGEYTDVAVP